MENNVIDAKFEIFKKRCARLQTVINNKGDWSKSVVTAADAYDQCDGFIATVTHTMYLKDDNKNSWMPAWDFTKDIAHFEKILDGKFCSVMVLPNIKNRSRLAFDFVTPINKIKVK